MKRVTKLATVAAFAAAVVLTTRVLYAAEEKAADPKEVIAVVGGEKITAGDIEDFLNTLDPANRRYYEGPEGRKVLLDIIIKNKILLKEAEKVGIPREKEIKDRIRRETERIIVTEYFRRYIGNPLGISDDEVRVHYEAHKADFLVPKRVKLRHVLVESEEEARSVLARLTAGEDFVDVARDVSRDENTGPAGGLIGEIARGYVPSQVGHCDRFEEVVFSLEAGVPSEPVQSDLGWHVFLVDQVTPEAYAPLDEVAAGIREKILVPDEAVRAYYLEHKAEFEVPEGARIRQIVLDTKADAEKAYARAVAGEDFETLAKLLTVDKGTKPQGGLVGWLKPGGYVQGVGYSEEYERAAFALEEGGISKPFEVRGKWYVIQSLGKRDRTVKDFEEVKYQISGKLFEERRTEAYERAYKELERKYGVERFGWARTYDDMNAEELLAAAEAAVMPVVRIEIYKKVYERFSDDEIADKALFMVGFTYSEELGDYDEAAVYFRRLLEEYPTSEFVQPAEWMLENMGKEETEIIPPGEND